MNGLLRRLTAALGLALSLGAALTAGQAAAQDSSVQATAKHFTLAESATFSKQIERDLAARGARVAMVFRAGRARDKLPEGIGYTHGAFWVHSDVRTPTGAVLSGYAVYNLYAGDGKLWPITESRLIQDWPFEFIQASTVDDVAVIIPSPEMQRRVMGVISSPAYHRLHNPAYALVANPWAQKYQNCNTFMLDVLAAAAWETDSPARVTADLRAHFKPTVIKAGMVERMFGPIADARLRNDDQRGPVRTATYESLAGFLNDNGLLQETYKLNFAR